jgi:hypothetical protein
VTTLAALQSLIAQGESETLEVKRSTAELKRAGETLCAFLNGEGGKVLIGVAPDGKEPGQNRPVTSTPMHPDPRRSRILKIRAVFLRIREHRGPGASTPI